MNKKLLKALQELVKDGQPFTFGFTPVPKSTEYEIAKGLDENMESELEKWIDDELAPLSEYHSTDYKLTFIDDKIHLDCNASWGGDNPYTKNDILTEKISKILLPSYDFQDIDLDYLLISFECTIDDSKADFHWLNEDVTYEDIDKGITIDIPLKPIEKELKRELLKIISDFEVWCYIDQEGPITTYISVEDSHPTVIESMSFQLTISLEDD